MSHPHLDDPSLHDALRAMVRRRVPASDVDDVVQSTLADAVAAKAPPSDREQLRRWVFGIARHKIVDAHRAQRARRHEPLDDHEGSPAVATDAHDASEASEVAGLLRWAERELPGGAEAESTLGLMLREGDGERLEHLAADARLPAATVRQRVHRMRAHFRARWALQVAIVLAIALGGLGLYWALGERHEMAIHPIVGTAPSQSMGGPSPSTSSVAPLPRKESVPKDAPSSSAPPAPAPAPVEPPPPAPPKKMLAPEPLQNEAPKDTKSVAPTKDAKPSRLPATQLVPKDVNANDFDEPSQSSPLPKSKDEPQSIKKRSVK
jgi:DNA-directed RNA polymerase specialized sigma24 family protein